MAQSDSAPRSGRGGRRFKSCHSDQHLTQNKWVFATRRHQPGDALATDANVERASRLRLPNHAGAALFQLLVGTASIRSASAFLKLAMPGS